MRRSSDSSFSVRLFHAYALTFLALALLVGGASRQEVFAPELVSLAAIPLIGLSVWRLRDRAGADLRLPLGILAALLALPLLQLIPLPYGLWTGLPGRDLVTGALGDAGVAPGWAPISLSPARTWSAFLALLPATAMFLAVLTLAAEPRRRAMLVVIAAGAVSVVVGALQLAGGPDSPLRVYEITNRAAAVGFFSNRNHLASLLICVVVLAAAWGARAALRRPAAFGQLAAALLVIVLAAIGAGMTGSRAGLVLLLPAGVGAALLAWRAGVARGRGKLALGVLAAGFVAALLIVQLSFGDTIARLQGGFAEDVRVTAAGVGWEAAKAFAPFGSGFGSFVPAYKIFEGPESVINTYINHAHDDWLEVLIEGGLPAALVMAVFLVWFGLTAWKLWRSDAADATPGRAGSLVVLLLLIHSALDYPLRTPAMMVVFALACGLMLPSATPRPRLAPANQA